MSKPSSDAAGIRQTIRALRDAGWELASVNDREEDLKVTNEAEALAAVTAVDEAFLYVTKGDQRGYVFFVLGNEPDEVICDYTVNLESAIGPLIEGWF